MLVAASVGVLLLAPAAPQQPTTGLSVTVAGAVSLGAYEAGDLYYFAEMLKQNPGAYDLKVATGASAGSINSLLTLMSACGAPQLSPSRALLYRAWIEVGLKELFVPEEVTPISIFSRRAMLRIAGEIEQAWNQGLPVDCDVVLGVAVTRLAPQQMQVKGRAFTLPRVEEKFAIRIRGQGAGTPPRATNYVDWSFKYEQPMLPLDGAGAGEFWPIRDLLFASSAFPLAFPPQQIHYCVTSAEGAYAPDERPDCVPAESRVDLFTDGGVFDNQPLRLAARLVSGGLARDPSGRLRWKEDLDRGGSAMPRDLFLLYLDPSTVSYPPPVEEGEPVTASAIALLSGFTGHFVASARAKDVVSLFENNPELRSSVSIQTVNWPTMSSLLFAFYGFIDRRFREFDFYLGMYHGHRHALDKAVPFLKARGYGEVHFPEDAARQGTPEEKAGWAPFECAHAVLDGDAAGAEICRDPALADFRTLLQVSLYRLYDHCRTLGEKGIPPETDHKGCREAMEGAEPPLVPGMTHLPSGEWRMKKGENDLGHTLRLLEKFGFVFRDLGLSREDSSDARLHLRYELGTMVSALADKQPHDGAVIESLARPALNGIQYLPSAKELHVTVGSRLEVGGSFTSPLSWWRFLRPTAALTFEGVSSFVATANSLFAVTPVAGLLVEPLPWNTGAVQWRFGLRGGYYLSSEDDFGTKACPNPDGDVPCSRPTLQLLAGMTLFQRLRFQLMGAVLPPFKQGEHTFWAIVPSAGFQFDWNR